MIYGISPRIDQEKMNIQIQEVRISNEYETHSHIHSHGWYSTIGTL